MEGRKSILDYIGQVFIIYGFTMLCMLCFALLFGESAKEFSDFLALGRGGVSTEIMAQFLLLSILVVLWQFFFANERVLKFLSVRAKSIAMVLSVFVTVILFIFIFKWFPIAMWQPWAMFFGCFAICVIGSTFLSIVKNNMENRKLEEGLSRLKGQWKEEEEKNE